MNTEDHKISSDYSKSMKKHIRTQQLRKAKKKSGQNKVGKKPRHKNWDAETLDEWDDLDHISKEPVMPRGDNERRRALEKSSKNQTQSKKATEPMESPTSPVEAKEDFQQGTVIEVSSGMARVSTQGETLLCTIRQALREQETGFTNVIAVGDEVLLNFNNHKEAVIESVLARKSILARMYRPDKGKMSDKRQIVAVNIDQVIIVASWREPKLWPELIDRYLIVAQLNELSPVLCINKIDLVKNQKEFEENILPYQLIGIPIIKTSVEAGKGIDNFQSLLTGKVSVLAGLSGVGKSSLLTAVQPNLKLRIQTTGTRGKNQNKGRHTTTQSSMIKLENGGSVIDTPGIREFGVNQLTKPELAGYYQEFSLAESPCKYHNCYHINENDCAVKEAVSSGLINKTRYENYCKIYETLPSRNEYKSTRLNDKHLTIYE